MNSWPADKQVQAGYSPSIVREHCVENRPWQVFRISLKGKPTAIKLIELNKWWENHYHQNPFITEVQVGNYLGALRRGGQLDMQNQVKRYI